MVAVVSISKHLQRVRDAVLPAMQAMEGQTSALEASMQNLKRQRDMFVKLIDGFNLDLKSSMKKLAKAKDGEVDAQAAEVLDTLDKYYKQLDRKELSLEKTAESVAYSSDQLKKNHLWPMAKAVQAVKANKADPNLRKKLEQLASAWSSAKQDAVKQVTNDVGNSVKGLVTELPRVKKAHLAAALVFQKPTFDKFDLIASAPDPAATKLVVAKLVPLAAMLLKESDKLALVSGIDPPHALADACRMFLVKLNAYLKA